MVEITKQKFGLCNNDEVFLYILKNQEIEVELINYGASVRSVKVPNKNGVMLDVVLGYDTISDYIKGDKFLGATVGRSANRIENGIVKLNGKTFQLSQNDGNNHIHGGFEGFNRKIWQACETVGGVKFFLISKDNEEGYPGNLLCSVTYTLEGSSLKISYSAKSDKDTVFNPTNHTYFNLEGGGSVLSEYVKINADSYTENDENSLPDGKVLPVNKTPMDFREFKQIGKDIESSFSQIVYGKGFDNNWVINGFDGSIKNAACAYSKNSGIKLEVLTDFPGIQFYSGNYLDASIKGKNSSKIDKHFGFCLECQYFPNAFAHENFLQPVLPAGMGFHKNIIYRFSNI